MNWLRIKGKLSAFRKILRGDLAPSGSQAGEDQIIRYLFASRMQIKDPTYLDIGTNHPFKCNNTFYFYSRGSHGVCIEPDPSFYRMIKKHRSRDTVLRAGIGLGNKKEDELYVFSEPYSGWNTFIKDEAEMRVKETGIPYNQVLTVPMLNINEVIEKYFDKWPNLISIDAEGLDLNILKTLDFSKYKPEVICVESITFSTTNQEKNIDEIEPFMHSKGYFAYANSHINTIYCRSDK